MDEKKTPEHEPTLFYDKATGKFFECVYGVTLIDGDIKCYIIDSSDSF